MGFCFDLIVVRKGTYTVTVMSFHMWAIFLYSPAVQNKFCFMSVYFGNLRKIQHDDFIKWTHFPRNWPFVRGIHRSPSSFPIVSPGSNITKLTSHTGVHVAFSLAFTPMGSPHMSINVILETEIHWKGSSIGFQAISGDALLPSSYKLLAGRYAVGPNLRRH